MSMYSSYLFERFCLFTYLPFLMCTAIRNPGAGLCLDAAGGFPGWAARVMPCHTSFDPQGWANNPITSATWRLRPDGTVRTNVSRAGE